jgi:hypothetical protein
MGCASNGNYAGYRPIPAGTALRLLDEPGEFDEVDAKAGAELVGQGASKGARAGASAGGFAGMIAGAFCGPAFLICSPALAIAGAGAGAVVGTAGGAVYGAGLGLPEDKAKAFESMVLASIQDSTPVGSLNSNFVARSGGLWDFTDAPSALIVELQFAAVKLEQGSNDQVAIVIGTSAVVHYGDAEEQRTRRFLFYHRGGSAHVDSWLANDGAAIRTLLDEAYVETTQDMIEAFRP